MGVAAFSYQHPELLDWFFNTDERCFGDSSGFKQDPSTYGRGDRANYNGGSEQGGYVYGDLHGGLHGAVSQQFGSVTNRRGGVGGGASAGGYQARNDNRYVV